MEIKTITTKKEYVVEELMVKYTPEDIIKLIQTDLESKGFVLNNISFKTESKYVSDEWGMDRHQTTNFVGAEVLVDKQAII